MSWKSSTSSSETTNGLARLVSQFRSSHHCAAHSFANFGIKGTPAIHDAGAVFGFEAPAQTRGHKDRNFKSTALVIVGLAARAADPTGLRAAPTSLRADVAACCHNCGRFVRAIDHGGRRLHCPSH